MAYVRKRGNQLAVVHGSRDPETRKVEQEILFTVYSMPEAREILSERPVDSRFRSWMEEAWPGIRFEWRRIRKGIEDGIGQLPDSHDYQTARSREEFRPALRAFARQLILNDPCSFTSSWHLVREHRIELEFLRDLIDERLAAPAPDPSHAEWMEDNPFHWRYVMSRRCVPIAVEEMLDGVHESGDLDRTEKLYSLLTELFDDYADGHNMLGVIAFERGDYEAAIEHFQKAVDLGRRHLPKRISKDRWWTDLSTRPYMRGLRNLGSAYCCAARYDEALRVCGLLDQCHDTLRAETQRASAHLARGEWELASKAACFAQNVSALEGLIAAFAEFELGNRERARVYFLHAALNYPTAVAEVLGQRHRGTPGYRLEDSPATGAVQAQSIRAFLDSRSDESRRFFRRAWKDSAGLRTEMSAARQQWELDRGTENREAFDVVHEMESLEFAERVWGGGVAR